MVTKIIPLIVSTEEALKRCLSEGCTLIYIESCLYAKMSHRLTDMMCRAGYAFAGETAKHGVFFLNTRHSKILDPATFEISDPLGIL